MPNLVKVDLYKVFRSTALYVMLAINLLYSVISVFSNEWYISVMESMGDSEFSYEHSTEYQAGYKIGLEIGKTISSNDMEDEELIQRINDLQNKKYVMSDFIGIFFTFNSMSYLLLAILSGIHISSEFSSGPVRNTIAKGYGRTSVFLSRLLVTFIEGMLLNTAMLAGAVISGAFCCESGRFGAEWLSANMLYILYAAVFCMAYSAIYTAIGFIAQSNITITVNILLFIFGGLLMSFIGRLLHAPIWNFWISNSLEMEYVQTYIYGDKLLFADNVLVALGYILIFGAAGIIIFKKRDIH